MKKETKLSIIIFIVIALVAYVTLNFIPDEVFQYSTVQGSLLGYLGVGVIKAVGMRVIIAITISVIVTLLIRIVDSEEKTTKSKSTSKKTAKKETK